MKVFNGPDSAIGVRRQKSGYFVKNIEHVLSLANLQV